MFQDRLESEDITARRVDSNVDSGSNRLAEEAIPLMRGSGSSTDDMRLRRAEPRDLTLEFSSLVVNPKKDRPPTINEWIDMMEATSCSLNPSAKKSGSSPGQLSTLMGDRVRGDQSPSTSDRSPSNGDSIAPKTRDNEFLLPKAQPKFAPLTPDRYQEPGRLTVPPVPRIHDERPNSSPMPESYKLELAPFPGKELFSEKRSIEPTVVKTIHEALNPENSAEKIESLED